MTRVRLASGVLLALCLSRSASAQVIPLRCQEDNGGIPRIIRSALLADVQLASDLNMSCTDSMETSLFRIQSDLVMRFTAQIANDASTRPPTLTVFYDRCFHQGNSIACPPGVPAGSNSQFFDPNGNAVFPGPNGTQIPVPPSSIFPFTTPPPVNGVVSANQVVWNGVEIDPRIRRVSISNLRVDPFRTAGAVRGMPVFGALTTSSSALTILPPASTLFPGTNNVLLGIVMPPETGPNCQSLLVLDEPGVTPFLFAQNVAAGNDLYNVMMKVSTRNLQYVLDVYDFPSRATVPASCQSVSTYNGATGNLDFQNVNYAGTPFWIQATASGGSFPISRFGTGAPPPR